MPTSRKEKPSGLASKAVNGAKTRGAARLSDRAYDELRRMIIDLSLQPGRRISEPELSEMLGHTTASVRAALQRLAQERLVSPIARKGYEVSALTIQDARNIFDLRLALEPSAAHYAAGRVKREDFRAIEKAFAQGFHPSKPESYSRVNAANKELRLIIARVTGNERLVGIVSGLLDELERYLRLSFVQHRAKSEQLAANVRGLIDALVRGDAGAAEEMTRAQLTETADRILATLMSRKQILAQPLDLHL
jgi:DNA-binding GntR family transcriptional regulator